MNGLKNLISLLGKTTPVETKDNPKIIPRSSCGELSETSESDEESCCRKIFLRRKQSKVLINNQYKKFINNNENTIPSVSSASKQSHAYSLPNFVKNLVSLKNVTKSINNIITKLFIKVKRSPAVQTKQIIKVENSAQNPKLNR